jgi:LysM repeat protein
MANQVSDKRKDIRVRVKGGTVQYKPKGGLFAFLTGSSDKYPILNISHRGLRFITQNKLEIDSRLSFNIGIPLLAGKPMRADGRVAWVQRSSRYNAYVIGVRFTAMTADSIKRLKNLVAFLGSKVMVKQRVKVTFPEEMTKQPTLWQIARDFDVTVNVAEGLVTDKSGWLVLDIEGDREEVRRVLVYLKGKGAKLAIPKVATRT